MQKDKTHRLLLEKNEVRAMAVLEKNKEVNDLNVGELDTLLAWYQAEKVKGAKKADKLAQWIGMKDTAPPQYDKWTEADDIILDNLMTKEIDIADTAYGRMQALKEREINTTIHKMLKEKREELRRKMDELDMIKSTDIDLSESPETQYDSNAGTAI